jgi:hypothetical protein
VNNKCCNQFAKRKNKCCNQQNRTQKGNYRWNQQRLLTFGTQKVELQVAIVEGKEAFVASQCNKSAKRSTPNPGQAAFA